MSVFVEKYNSFFSVNPKFFYNKKAITEFTSDIDILNNNLWSLINIKQKESVKELDSIKNSGFIENELVGFYKNIKNLFLIETEKFLEMINSIINLYKIKKEGDENEEESFTKEAVLQGSIPVQFEIKNKTKKENNNNDSIQNKDEKQKMNDSHISEVSNEEEDMNTTNNMNKIISNISTNIEIFYVNGIKLVYNLQNKTENLIKLIKDALMQTFKKPKRKRLNSNANESFNSSQMISMIGTTARGIDPFAHEEKIRRMFQNEKNKYKYRIYYLKEFCNKYIKMIFKTTTNIYNNVDGWIVQSVSLQNNALNTVIGKIKELLNDKKLIDEKVDIEPIEMDAFEIENNNNNNKEENNAGNDNENNEEEVLVKPIDDKSIVSNTVYYKLNIDYLLKDNFINYKIEEIKSNDNLNEKKDDEITNVKEEEINADNKSENINANIDMKEAKENEFKYYYDINNFYNIYTMIKRYEIEENTISQDILNQMFFRQYVLNVYNDLNEGNKTNEDNNKENKDKSEEEEDEEKANQKHKELKKKKYLSPICDGLKGINTKKIFKLFNLYHIPVEIHEQEHKKENENENENEKGDLNKEDAKNGTLEKVNENEEEHKADEENKNEEENKDKDKEKEENKIEDNKEKEEGNENKHEEENNSENDEKEDTKDNNENKENKEEEKKVEYETYIKLKDLFTILSLIGCQILTVDEDDKINKELKDKIVKNGFLTKEDFMEYNFWFEKYFDYQNNLDNLNDEEYEWIIDEHKDKRMTIKDFLFELWKDDTGNSINIKKILSILKIGNYITDISNNDNKKYYDVILDQ